jgi:serine/threonine protein kinase
MSQDLLGTEIGGYAVLQQIGAGGNGIVFRAMHTRTKKPVAIKVLLDLKSSSSGANRFLEEARVIREINHPNIVEIYELKTLPDGRPYMVMELLQGEGLEKYLKVKRRLHTIEALEICIPVAEALNAAHQKGVIHRDLKPDNIFLGKSAPNQRQIKLLDFGIAKFRGPEGTARITQSGMLLGTPHYMSPEQANQPKTVDGRSDLYALGVILYEMVTGKLPFDSETPIAVLFLHFDRAPTPPSKHVPGLSAKVESLILRCLSKTPAGRPADAAAFLQECRDIVQYERIEALKKTKAAPSPLNTAFKPPNKASALTKDNFEDEATSVGPMSEELEEILDLDDAIELQDPLELTKDVPALDPNKTTEDGYAPFSRDMLASIRGSQELTQPKASPNEEMARLILAKKTPTPQPKPIEAKPLPSKLIETKASASARLASKPLSSKPEEASRIKPTSAPAETKGALLRPNKAFTKPQKSDEPPASLTDDDTATAKGKTPGPKTIQTYSDTDEAERSVPSTLLMMPVDEAVCLRLTLFPREAKIIFWINDSAHHPEITPEEIFAAKKSIVEITVAARGFLPKQVTILATKDLDIAVTLERPGPRSPMASKTPTPTGSKR